jgi:cell division protein FtsB
MIRRARIRAALAQLSLWALIAALTSYFVYHGVHGERGLRAHRSIEAEIAELGAELARLEAQREALEQRVARFEPTSVDRDVLDEQSRRSLGLLHPNDRVLMLEGIAP